MPEQILVVGRGRIPELSLEEICKNPNRPQRLLQVVADHGSEPFEFRMGAPQLILRRSTRQELSNLITDRPEQLHRVVVGSTALSGEEFQHTEDLILEQDRECHAGLETE